MPVFPPYIMQYEGSIFQLSNTAYDYFVAYCFSYTFRMQRKWKETGKLKWSWRKKMKKKKGKEVKEKRKGKRERKNEEDSLIIYEWPWDSLAWGQRLFYREGQAEGSRPLCVSPLVHRHTHTQLHCLSLQQRLKTDWRLTLFWLTVYL